MEAMHTVNLLRAAARQRSEQRAREALARLGRSDRIRTLKLAEQAVRYEREQAGAPVSAPGTPVDGTAAADELETLRALRKQLEM